VRRERDLRRLCDTLRERATESESRAQHLESENESLRGTVKHLRARLAVLQRTHPSHPHQLSQNGNSRADTLPAPADDDALWRLAVPHIAWSGMAPADAKALVSGLAEKCVQWGGTPEWSRADRRLRDYERQISLLEGSVSALRDEVDRLRQVAIRDTSVQLVAVCDAMAVVEEHIHHDTSIADRADVERAWRCLAVHHVAAFVDALEAWRHMVLAKYDVLQVAAQSAATRPIRAHQQREREHQARKDEAVRSGAALRRRAVKGSYDRGYGGINGHQRSPPSSSLSSPDKGDNEDKEEEEEEGEGEEEQDEWASSASEDEPSETVNCQWSGPPSEMMSTIEEEEEQPQPEEVVEEEPPAVVAPVVQDKQAPKPFMSPYRIMK
jgi:hypothetical protein